ncbi:MAG: hypothetical protein J6W37_08215 [Bacteroidales bacterium]|nr:hypothetical protein [Bacteroidales bacterium]
MKKIFVLSVLVSSMLFFGCKKEDDDVRNPYCGIYTGMLNYTQRTNNNEISQPNRVSLDVRKNGKNIKSVSVYDSNSGSLMFTTESMSVVSTVNGDGFCGQVYESISKDEDGIDVTTTGLPVSEGGKYSCEITPNESGTLTLRFIEQESYVNSHGMDVVKTYEFEGTKN